jgi:transglutaminase-like putative cysteine protease
MVRFRLRRRIHVRRRKTLRATRDWLGQHCDGGGHAGGFLSGNETRRRFMLRSFRVLACCLLAIPTTAVAAEPAKSRQFDFEYAFDVIDLKPGQVAKIWMPVPPSNSEQEVTLLRRQTATEIKIGKESKYGNQVMYIEAAANSNGRIANSVSYRVKRNEVVAGPADAISDDVAKSLLKPDSKVPVDGKPLSLLSGKTLPADQDELGRFLYDIVNHHMRYSKEGTGWGRGDSEWACESGYGNCSDFHSLFISLARSQKMPAKFEIGFALPEQHGKGDIAGYHCWAKFRPAGKGWVPVDISEANKNPKMTDYYYGHLTADRVTFSTGRDLTLEPKQDGPSVNFFVYPYVEVDGKPYPSEKVIRHFRFEDVE